ncbi:hypothetical protein [Oceanobacter sp. 3_MG-2023]|uniref:hypothetical protein n=1 Tax=Oceanobacter sp. 3_MG-2023 TaxID=3062622 RepID=UPI0027356D63|nr:hypothetical protein [Oceanobacter sp. 3_MG-2023]MDP2506721.1 hypothetical protein [Oceanobacter sp. 3_MG-2023]
MSVTDLFSAACKKAIELKGWAVSETVVECSERFAWGFLFPEMAWKGVYKELVGSDWFDVFIAC